MKIPVDRAVMKLSAGIGRMKPPARPARQVTGGVHAVMKSWLDRALAS